MREYVNVENKTVVSEEHLRQLFPNEYLGKMISDEVAKRKGYAAVIPSPKPSCTLVQYVVRNGAVINAHGVWEQAWDIKDMDADQRANALEQYQQTSWANIENKRDYLEEAEGVLVKNTFDNYFWFQTDHVSRIKLMSLYAMKIDVPPVEWKLLDGIIITLTHDLLSAYAKALAIHHNKIHRVARLHRAKMLQSDDPVNYDFSQNWPLSYTQGEIVTISINNNQKALKEHSETFMTQTAKLHSLEIQLLQLKSSETPDIDMLKQCEEAIRIATKIRDVSQKTMESAKVELQQVIDVLQKMQENNLMNDKVS